MLVSFAVSGLNRPLSKVTLRVLRGAIKSGEKCAGVNKRAVLSGPCCFRFAAFNLRHWKLTRVMHTETLEAGLSSESTLLLRPRFTFQAAQAPSDNEQNQNHGNGKRVFFKYAPG